VLEDMLHLYVMGELSKWEDYLHLVELAYDNEKHISLKMSPFEALYGITCGIIVSQYNPMNMIVLGP
jgi:hypothetical protein